MPAKYGTFKRGTDSEDSTWEMTPEEFLQLAKAYKPPEERAKEKSSVSEEEELTNKMMDQLMLQAVENSYQDLLMDIIGKWNPKKHSCFYWIAGNETHGAKHKPGKGTIVLSSMKELKKSLKKLLAANMRGITHVQWSFPVPDAPDKQVFTALMEGVIVPPDMLLKHYAPEHVKPDVFAIHFFEKRLADVMDVLAEDVS